jgi:hypothetical protein
LADPVEVKVDATALTRAAEHAPVELARHIKLAFTRILQGFNARHITERMRGRPGVNTLTGSLRRSLQWRVSGETLEDLRGIYFTTSVYGPTQEFGEPNKVPKRKQFLAIPLDAARMPAGAARFASPLLESQALKAAYPGGTFVARSKAGNLIIFGKGDGKEITPLFVLKRSVAIPPRLGTRDLWKVYLPDVQAEVAAAGQRALAEAANRGAV